MCCKLKVEEKKKEKGDSEFEDKVDKLYEMMSRWDVACTGLSSAVKRMYDLRKLHEQGNRFHGSFEVSLFHFWLIFVNINGS